MCIKTFCDDCRCTMGMGPKSDCEQRAAARLLGSVETHQLFCFDISWKLSLPRSNDLPVAV